MKRHFRLMTVLLTLGLPFAAAAVEVPKTPSPLIDKVRAATERYKDVNVAIAEGWVPGTPCVSGPNSGAMGVHFILPPLGAGLPPPRIGDGVVNASRSRCGAAATKSPAHRRTGRGYRSCANTSSPLQRASCGC